MKHDYLERALGTFLIFFVSLGLVRPATAEAAAPQVPVVHTAVPATVPQYGKVQGEWDIALGTLADGTAYEPRIPYTDVMDAARLTANLAAYGPRLAHSEDPRSGVTVTAVLTDPTGTVHAPWPLAYYEDMTVAAGTSSTLPYDALPTGYAGWHLNYRPKVAGTWTGRIVVTDAGGTVTSPAFTFAVSGMAAFPDAAGGDIVPGNVLYSNGDGRSLVYSGTGNLWQPLGECYLAAAGSSASDPDTDTRLAGIHSGGARGLLRVWQNSNIPLIWGGGDFEYGTSATVASGANGVSELCARNGRNGYKLTSTGGDPANADTTQYYSPSGQAERYGVWVKAVGVNPGATVGLQALDPYEVPYSNDQHGTDTGGSSITDGAWHYVTGTVPVMPAGDYGYPLVNTANGQKHLQAKSVRLATGGLTSGYFAVDDWAITEQSHDPAAGPGSAWDLLGGEGDYESQNHLNNRGGAMLDHTIASARSNDCNLLLEFFTSRLNSQAAVNSDGSNALAQTSQATGAISSFKQEGAYSSDPTSMTDDGCETAVGLMHFQQVWQWVGRYGWAVGQGIALLDYANELDHQSGPVFGADHWAVQMRRVTPDVKPLCAVNFGAINSGDSFWPWAAYESPWLQWAEYHGGPYGAAGQVAGAVPSSVIPYNANPAPYQFLTPYAVRRAAGGPFGWGYTEFASSGSASNRAYMQLPTVRVSDAQAGRNWTLSYYAETVPDAEGHAWSSASKGFLIDLSENDGNSGFSQGQDFAPASAALPTAGLPTWSKVSLTFTAPAGIYRGVMLQIHPRQTSGDVRVSGLQLTDPDGRVFWQARFNEPILGAGTGDAQSVWDETFDYSDSGAAAFDRPTVIGEDEAYGSTINTVGEYATNSIAFPMDQYAMRYAAAMPDPRWHMDTWWVEDSMTADIVGASKPFHTVQSLMDGFVAADGSWRAMPTAQSGYAGGNEPFVVYAQSDNRSAATGAIVEASKAIAGILPVLPDPATSHGFLPGTGMVDLQGLADAAYTVQEYDAASGNLTASLTATSAGHHLPLTFSNVGGGLIVKVLPVSAPNLTLRLTVDHATAVKGDIVTYTLTYTNAGTGPALGVTVPWSVPAHMQFLSAAGGNYDSAANVVHWSLGALAPGASGSVQLKARVQ